MEAKEYSPNEQSAFERLAVAEPTALPHEDELIVAIAGAWELSPETTSYVLGCSVNALQTLDLSYLQVGQHRRYMKKTVRDYLERTAVKNRHTQ